MSMKPDRRLLLGRGLVVGAVPLIGAVLPQLARGQGTAKSSSASTNSAVSVSSVSASDGVTVTIKDATTSAASSGSSVASASAPSGVSSSVVPPRAASGDAGYNKDELVTAGSNFLGVTAEALGAAIEHIFSDNGDKPTAYIAGSEGSGSFGVGLRYGKGNLFMKSRPDPTYVYWQGPSVGFDTGGNLARVFTLIYHLEDPEKIFQRFPGVEGSAYFIGGLGVNYQQADDIRLAPVRAGIGFRLGASLGYLAYTKKRHYLPL